MNFLNNEIIEVSEAIASELKDLPGAEQKQKFRTSVENGYREMIKNGAPSNDAQLQISILADHVISLLATPNPEIKNFVSLAIADFQLLENQHRNVMAGRMLEEITSLGLPMHEQGELLLALGARLARIDEIKSLH